MPTYEYRCRDCGHTFDIVQKMSDASLTHCPECGGELRKVFAPPAIAFKGSGFYATDHGKKSRTSSDADKDKKESGTKNGDSKSEGTKDGDSKERITKDGGKESKKSETKDTGSGSSSSTTKKEESSS
jgi:putative FmdB family regulatory protein